MPRRIPDYALQFADFNPAPYHTFETPPIVK
jgi:hypothetical protein